MRTVGVGGCECGCGCAGGRAVGIPSCDARCACAVHVRVQAGSMHTAMPGRRRLASSAWFRMFLTMRSLMLNPGFKNSALARSCTKGHVGHSCDTLRGDVVEAVCIQGVVGWLGYGVTQLHAVNVGRGGYGARAPLKTTLAGLSPTGIEHQPAHQALSANTAMSGPRVACSQSVPGSALRPAARTQRRARVTAVEVRTEQGDSMHAKRAHVCCGGAYDRSRPGRVQGECRRRAHVHVYGGVVPC